MNINEKNSVLLIAYWGPEIRNMVFSGLVEYILREKPVTLLSRVTEGDFTHYIPKGCNLVKLPTINISRTLGRISALGNRSHGIWLDKLGISRALAGNAGLAESNIGIARHVKNNIAPLCANKFVIKWIQFYENRLVKAYARSNPEIKKILNYAKPSSMLSMDTVHFSSILFSQAVKDFGGISVFFAGNWKDIDRGYRARSSYDIFLVWNDIMKNSLLKQNPHLIDKQVKAVGSPQFDINLRKNLLMERSNFCEMFELKAHRPIICFSAASKRVIPREAATVKEICIAIKEGIIKKMPYIIVRLNPTGSDPDFINLAKDFDFVRLSKPIWDYRPNLFGGQWQASDFDDLAIYVNTIYHSILNVSAPSTVTLDFAVLDRPVVNVLYDPPGSLVEGRSVSTFANQDIYEPAVRFNACKISTSPKLLFDNVNAYLSNPSLDKKGRKKFVRSQLGLNLGRSVELIAKELLN